MFENNTFGMCLTCMWQYVDQFEEVNTLVVVLQFVRCPEWLVETGQDLGIGKGDRPP